MSISDIAGVGGLGFVLIAIVVNVMYICGRLPMPALGSARSLDDAIDAFATARLALRKPSVLAPVSWLFLTVFAGGLVAELWRDDPAPGTWALVGLSGVLLQNATFACVEALRFALSEAATHARDTVVGLWTLSNVLFGFNQVFLATALLGFTAAGATAEVIPLWHAVLGYVSAALLVVSASATPFNADGAGKVGLAGLVGWIGWIAWIVVYGITLIAL